MKIAYRIINKDCANYYANLRLIIILRKQGTNDLALGACPRIETVVRESYFESGFFQFFEANSRLFNEKNREIWSKSAFPQ
jgi:hypothetical protein